MLTCHFLWCMLNKYLYLKSQKQQNNVVLADWFWSLSKNKTARYKFNKSMAFNFNLQNSILKIKVILQACSLSNHVNCSSMFIVQSCSLFKLVYCLSLFIVQVFSYFKHVHCSLFKYVHSSSMFIFYVLTFS